MSSAAMEALKREANRDLNTCRNDLATARREMGNLGSKIEEKVRELVRQGIYTSHSIEQDSSDPYKRRVSLTFNTDTDAAKAYVERIPDIVTETADRLIGQKIKKLDDRLQYYHEKALDADTFDSFVRLMTEWKNYTTNLQVQVSSATITLEMSESLKEMEKKWKDIAAKKKSVSPNNPSDGKQHISYGGINFSNGSMVQEFSSQLSSINLRQSNPVNTTSRKSLVEENAKREEENARREEEQRKAAEQARLRAEAERKEQERKEQERKAAAWERQLKEAESKERALFLEDCKKKKDAFNKELEYLERKRTGEAKRIRENISSWQTMMGGFGLFQFAGKRGAREEIEKLESELRMLPDNYRKQIQNKWDQAPADVRDAFWCLSMYTNIKENPDCTEEDAKKFPPKGLGFAVVGIIMPDTSIAQREAVLNQLKKAKLVVEIPVNGAVVYRAVKNGSTVAETIKLAQQAEQARKEQERQREIEARIASEREADYMGEIIKLLSASIRGMTLIEIMDALGNPDDLTPQQVSAILRRFQIDGTVTKEIIGVKAYFKLAF